jgi:hypothetical protein
MVFFFVFFKHINDMRSLIYIANNNNIWVDDPTIVSEFINVIIKLRYELNLSICKLSNIYVSSTILGAIALGNVIDNLKSDPLSIISCVIFVIFQIIFLYIIFLISEQQNNLSSIIQHPVFSSKYIYRRYKPFDFPQNSLSNIPFFARSTVNIESLDYSATSIGRLLKNFRVKNIISNKNSPSNKIPPINPDDIIQLGNLDDIQRDTTPIKDFQPTTLNSSDPPSHILDNNISEIIIKKTPKKTRSHKHSHHHHTKEEFLTPATPVTPASPPEIKDLSPELKEIIKKINQISNFNGSSTDYIILHLLISENWTNNFSLLGIQFNNSDSIKKAIGITSIIAIISGIISQFVIIN